jgi:hypothetical protein
MLIGSCGFRPLIDNIQNVGYVIDNQKFLYLMKYFGTFQVILIQFCGIDGIKNRFNFTFVIPIKFWEFGEWTGCKKKYVKLIDPA